METKIEIIHLKVFNLPKNNRNFMSVTKGIGVYKEVVPGPNEVNITCVLCRH